MSGRTGWGATGGRPLKRTTRRRRCWMPAWRQTPKTATTMMRRTRLSTGAAPTQTTMRASTPARGCTARLPRDDVAAAARIALARDSLFRASSGERRQLLRGGTASGLPVVAVPPRPPPYTRQDKAGSRYSNPRITALLSAGLLLFLELLNGHGRPPRPEKRRP